MRKPSGNSYLAFVRAALFAMLGFGASTSIADADAPLMAVPGHLGVSPTGASTYSVPIAVPPGTAGMVPSISLNYSSLNRNGFVGWGWSLSYGVAAQGHSGNQEPRANGRQPILAGQQGGTSTDSAGTPTIATPFGSGGLTGGDMSGDIRMIMRCPRTMAQDGIHGGVNYDANDRFCMDGRRLILISGTYGADGSEYRTEIESFTRIIAHGVEGTGPAWFEVHNKSGQTLEFGHTTDSNVPAVSVARAWALDKVTDTKGNYLTVTYTLDGPNSTVYPLRIDYTGNAGAGLATYNSVQFVYTSRVDVVPYYQAGVLEKSNQLLTDVKTYQGTTAVLDYKLAYRIGGAVTHSRLTSVTLCDGAGANCLPATTFNWQGGTGTVSFGSLIPVSYGGSSPTEIIADINGDGIPDTIAEVWSGCLDEWQLYTGNPSGGFTLANPAYYCPPFGSASTVDLNGDGLPDFQFAFSTGNGFQINTGSGLTPASGALSGTYWPGDFNGDGRTDFYSNAWFDGTSAAELWLSNGDGTFSAGSAAPGINDDFGVADFDGDGCTDVIANLYPGPPPPPTPNAIVYYSCNPAISSVVASTASNHDLTIAGDINGDGKTDIYVGSASSPSAILNLSTGTGFTPTTFDLNTIFSLFPSDHQILVGDFNGDGMADIAVFSNGPPATVTVFLSTGTGFVNAGSTTLPSGYGVLTIADLNGDGAPDLALFSGGSAVLTGEILTNYTPELITSVSNGIGANTTIKYDRLNARTLYTKGSGATYPTQDIDNGMYVVSEIDASNGLGTCAPPTMTYCYVTTYSYAGAKSDLAGRGFLGFSSVKTTDAQTGLVQTTNYRTDFPYIGLMSSQTTVTTQTRSGCTAGVTLTSIANTYTAVNLGGTRNFVSLQQSDVTGNDCEGSALPETVTAYTYDAYGNATQVSATIKMSGVVSSTSVANNTFTNDAVNWLFLLTNSAVTNTLGSSVVTRTTSYGYATGTDFLNHETVEPGSGTLLVDTTYTLDAFGNRTAATTTGSAFTSRTTHASYDTQGRFALTTTDALGFVDHYTNDPAFGGMLSQTDPNGLATSWTYDTLGRKTQENHPDGTTVVFTFGPVSGGPTYSVYSTTATPKGTTGSQNGPHVTAYFDLLGRAVFTATDGFSATIDQATYYNANGQVLQSSRPYTSSPVWTTFTYDDLGRVKTATAPDTGVTSTVYHGLSVSVTNPLGQLTTMTKNPQGLTASVTDALDAGDPGHHTTSYAFDSWGDLASVTDPKGNVTANTYDIRGDKLTSTDPDLGVWHYTYDGLGELMTQTDAKSQVTTITYDLTGRMTQRVEPDLTSNWTFGTAAPNIRRLASETTSGPAGNNGGFVRSYAYDSLSRESTATTGTIGIFFTTTYNTDDRIDTLQYPSGFTAKYVYTSLGYLSQIKDNASGAVLYTVQGRNADLSLTQALAGSGVTTTDTYDANTGRLTNVRAGATNNVADFDYAYDLLGNATYRADGYAGVFERFCYDALNRLTKSALAVGSDPGSSCAGGTVKTIGYDSLGDITSKSDVGTYGYPTSGSGAVRPHAISSITGTVNGVTNPSYTYDPNGNMTAGAGRTVTLSSFNMPLSLVQGTTSVALRYDPEHMRSSRVDSVGGASSSTGFVLDPANGATSELYNDGSVLHWHDYLEVDGHYVAERFCDGYPTCTGPTWKYFVTDNLGSIASITDSAGTVPLERDAYDPWGRPRVYATGADDPTCGSVPPPITKRGYTGHEHIESECLVNANARIYDPTVARFMSPDTTVTDPTDLQDWNPYSYVDNRPLTVIDPTGHMPCAQEPSCSITNFNQAPPASAKVTDTTVTVREGIDNNGNVAGTVGIVDSNGNVVPGTAQLAAEIVNSFQSGAPTGLGGNPGAGTNNAAPSPDSPVKGKSVEGQVGPLSYTMTQLCSATFCGGYLHLHYNGQAQNLDWIQTYSVRSAAFGEDGTWKIDSDHPPFFPHDYSSGRNFIDWPSWSSDRDFHAQTSLVSRNADSSYGIVVTIQWGYAYTTAHGFGPGGVTFYTPAPAIPNALQRSWLNSVKAK
jgi:RHS repeat-associated protein